MENNEYKLWLRGYNVILYPSESSENSLTVTLYEEGSEVFTVEMPIDIDEESAAVYSEGLVDSLAQGAIDLFEASRGTLGQGAGATMKANIKKNAYCVSNGWEDWYLKLKGTKFEDQATAMLDQLIELNYSGQDPNQQAALDAAYAEQSELEHDLDLLNFERLKSTDPHQTIIVIQAQTVSGYYGIYDAQGIGAYLDKFKGNILESQAIAKTKELLDVKVRIENLQDSEEDTWDDEQDLENAMHELVLQNIQQNAIATMPETGMESAPAMTSDMAELMQGVDLDTPIEPMIAKRSFQEDESEVVELGEIHEGLDPAEIPIDDYPFEIGDGVKLKKEFVDVIHGGIEEIISKGTKGTIDSLWDGQGDQVLVVLDDGNLIRVPTSYLSKSK